MRPSQTTRIGPLRLLRLLVFYIVSLMGIAWFGVTSLIFCSWLPYRQRIAYLMLWNQFSIGWGKIACGVNYRVIGTENIPDGPVVVLSKHESQWETIFLQQLMKPVVTVLKKELLSIPLFGWALKLMQPIAIDRRSPRKALQQILHEGTDRLEQGCSVLIFPEGTRTQPGETGHFARSGASLAIKAGVPVLPVAHNAAVYWPAKTLLRHPGTITVVIGPAIATEGMKAMQVTDKAESWVRSVVTQLAVGNAAINAAN